MKLMKPQDIINYRSFNHLPSITLYANDANEFKKVFDEAVRIANATLSSRLREYLFGPLDKLIQEKSIEKWKFPKGIFLSESLNACVNLPFEVNSLSVVASSFHVKPLLKVMQRELPFLLLFFCRREAALFRGSVTSFIAIERLKYDKLREVGDLSTAIDRTVYRLSSNTTTPLLLAGDFEKATAYRNDSLYPVIVEDVIAEVADLSHRTQLHREAINVLEPFMSKHEEKLIKSFQRSERDGLTTSNLNEIMDSAVRKRVKHIFVNERENIWGKISPLQCSPVYSERNEDCVDDILDDLAELVFQGGGEVTVLSAEKMPGGCSACAILHW